MAYTDGVEGERVVDAGLAREIGGRLRRWRRERGLTQVGLAQRAGLHRSSVGAIERGKQRPSWGSLGALAGALAIDPVELLPLAHVRPRSDGDAWGTDSHLRLLTDALPALVAYVDADQRYVFTNQAFEDWFGRDRTAYRGRTVREMLGETAYSVIRQHIDHVLGGQPTSFEALVPYQDGGQRYVQAALIPDRDAHGAVRGYFSLIHDLTERKRAEQALRFVAEAGKLLSASLNYETTLRRVADLVVPGLADWCVVDLLGDNGLLKRVAVAHADPERAALAWEIHAKYPPDREAPDGVAEVLRTGRPVLYQRLTDEQIATTARAPEHLRLLRALDIRASLIAPLVVREQVLGAVTLVRCGNAPDFSSDDMTVIEDVARQAADAIGNAKTFRAAQNEIGHRERAERALRESEERFRMIAERAQDVIYRFRIAEPHGFEYISPSVAKLSGYTPEEFYADPDLGRKVVYPDDPLISASVVLASGDMPGPVSQRWIRKDGTILWMEHSFSLIRDGTGRIVALDGIARDITERRRAEEVQRFSAEAGRVLAASLDFDETARGIAQVAVPALADWCIIDTLEEAGHIRRLATVHPDPLKSDLLARLTHFPPDLTDPINPAVRVIQSGRVEVLADVTPTTFVAAAQDAEHLAIVRALAPTSIIVLPLIARDRILGALWLASAQPGRRYGPTDLVLAEDLGRRAALALDNARLYREAQGAIRARDEFLSIASHELRTPVAGVKGYAQLLQRSLDRGRLDPERLSRSLRAINQASDRLSELTGDLLDVSRIRLGQLPIRPRPVDFGACVVALVARYQDNLHDQLVMIVEVPAHPVPLTIDTDRIEQVLVNLLDNATKYSPAAGTISVTVSVGDGVLLTVRDEGIGLPPGAATRIFEPFGRAANAVEHNLPGMGLGLYICRNIAERHGGRIWAESAGEGLGTTLSLWLPESRCDPLVVGE